MLLKLNRKKVQYFEKNTILYSLAVVLLSGIGLLEFERGFFWTKEQNDILDDSDFT